VTELSARTGCASCSDKPSRHCDGREMNSPQIALTVRCKGGERIEELRIEEISSYGPQRRSFWIVKVPPSARCLGSCAGQFHMRLPDSPRPSARWHPPPGPADAALWADEKAKGRLVSHRSSQFHGGAAFPS
jgi:hypothetical protein